MRLPVRLSCLLAGAAALIPLSARADAVLFTDTSLTALAGFGYAVDPARNLGLTLENFTGLSVGDSYFFLDAYHFPRSAGSAAGANSFYVEWSPRLSLGKLAGAVQESGLLRDLLVTATLEKGEGRVAGALAGLAIDLNGIGQYFQLNLYRRNELRGRGFNGWQLTPVFAFPFTVGGQSFLVDGFADIVFDSGSRADSVHINPQLKWNLLSRQENPLWVGLELDWWTNKYGIRDSAAFNSDQKIGWSLIARYHF